MQYKSGSLKKMNREVAKGTLDIIGAEEEVRWHKEAPNGQRIIFSSIQKK
jgi:hypothetical protein